MAIADRGSNVLTDISGNNITASLTSAPNGNEQLLPANNLTLPIIAGVAKFDQLYINESGSPFEITFTSSYVSHSYYASFYAIILSLVSINYSKTFHR